MTTYIHIHNRKKISYIHIHIQIHTQIDKDIQFTAK